MKNLIITEYRTLQENLSRLEQRLEAIKADRRTHAVFEGLEKIRIIMDEHAITAEDLQDYLGLDGKSSKQRIAGKHSRVQKTWANPHTGERFTAKRASGPVLEWIEQYGKVEVKSWIE